jgi:diguanylate cyclase (GGDEF)-like protein/PAS domain S-box-containing protein
MFPSADSYLYSRLEPTDADASRDNTALNHGKFCREATEVMDGTEAHLTSLEAAVPLLPPWWPIFEGAPDAMLIANDKGVYVAANRAACLLLALPREVLVGCSVADFLPPGTDFPQIWQRFLATGQARGEQLLYLGAALGNSDDTLVVKTVEFAATAHIYPHHHLSILRDVTDRNRREAERHALSRQLEQWVISSSEKLEMTEAKLRSQQQRIDSILNSLECAVWSIHPHSQTTIYVSAAVESIYGYPPADFLADPGLWFRCIHSDDAPRFKADLTALMENVKVDREYRIYRSDGSLRWVRWQARLVRNGAGLPMRIDGTTVDISDRKQAEATQAELNRKLQQVNTELNRLATVDGLTEIANRRYFDQALDLEWQRAHRQQQPIALILCDIDYFKPYNDNYGHLAGDDCLRQVAQVINAAVLRPSDMAARYGGEEFALLLPSTTINGAVQIVKRIQSAIARCNLPHAYSAVSSVITLSFGLVCHRPMVREHSPRELIHQADLALYQAKAQGRNGYAICSGYPEA